MDGADPLGTTVSFGILFISMSVLVWYSLRTSLNESRVAMECYHIDKDYSWTPQRTNNTLIIRKYTSLSYLSSPLFWYWAQRAFQEEICSVPVLTWTKQVLTREGRWRAHLTGQRLTTTPPITLCSCPVREYFREPKTTCRGHGHSGLLSSFPKCSPVQWSWSPSHYQWSQ